MAFPTAPVGAAGGVLVLKYTNPVDKHLLRVHIPGFAGSPSTSPVATGTTDWAYSATPGVAVGGSTLEATVGETAVDLIDAIKPLFGATAAFSIAALYKIVNQVVGGVTIRVAQQVFPLPVLGAEVGTNAGTLLATDIARVVTSFYNGRTSGNPADNFSGRRFQLRLSGALSRLAGFHSDVSPSTGGYSDGITDQQATDQALVGYLSQQHAINARTSVILGHDGQIPTPDFHLTCGITKKLQRKVAA